jgi:autotransporter-associated beta strand protein
MKLQPLFAGALCLAPLQPLPGAEFFKANNTTALNLPGSWINAALPGGSDVAVWDTPFDRNPSLASVLGTSAGWQGIRIAGPLNTPRIRASAGAILTLGSGGIDMSLATQNFLLDCNTQLGASQTWTVAAGRTLTATLLDGSAGSTLTKAGDGTLSLNGAVSFAGGLVFGGPVSGSGVLEKSAVGALTLPAGNAGFSGTTRLLAGTLNVNHGDAFGSSAVAIEGGALDNSSGAAVVLTGTAPMTWTGNFAFGGSNELDLGTSVVTVAGDRTLTVNAGLLKLGGAVTGSGSLTKGGPGTLELAGGAAVALNGKLAVGGGLLKVAGGSLECGLTSGGVEFTGGVIELAGGALKARSVTGTGGAGTLRFNGGVLRPVNDSASFISGLSATQISGGGAILELDGWQVTLAQGLSRDPSLEAAADGGLRVRDSLGGGYLTLNGASSYTGPTVIESGTLEFGTNGSIAASASIEVGKLGTLDASGGMTLASGQMLLGTGTVRGDLNAASGSTVAPGGGVIDNLTMTGSLKISGEVVMQISKAGAVLSSDRVNGLQFVSYGGTLTVTASGGALATGNKFTLFESVNHAGGFATLNLPTLPTGLFWETSGLLVDGSIQVTNILPVPYFNPPAGNYLGAQSVTINGPAGSTIHYTIDGSDPLTSPTRISAPAPVIGVVVPVDSDGFRLKAATALSGFPASAVTTAVYNTLSTPVWTLNGSGDWSEAANWRYGIIGEGGGITADFSKLTLNGDATVTLDSALTIGSLTFGDTGNAFGWTVAGTPALTLNNLGGTPSVTVLQRTTTLTVPVAGGSGLAKDGPGTLVLGGPNSYTGSTAVNGGTLVLQGASVSNNYAISPGAVLELNVATGSRDHPATTFNGTGTLRKTSAGSFVVGSAPCTFALGSGALIDIQAGTLVGGSFANEVWTANLADLNVAAGAIFDAVEATSVANNGVFVDALTGAGTIKVGYPGSYANRITFGVDNGSGSFSGVLVDSSAPGSFVKAGSGSQTLGGACTYTGTTTVNGGALIVNGSLSASSAVTVASAATLGGSGNAAGVVTVNSGATLAPGNNNAGSLATGALTLAGTYQCQLDGATADRVAVAGNLNLAGATLAVSTLNPPAAGPFIIATFTGTRTGTFASVSPGYTVDYSTPNQVRLVASSGVSYTSWVAGFGLSGAAAQADADPDFDGIANLVEFVLGGNPATVSDSALLPTVALVNNPGGTVPPGQYLRFTYRRTADSAYLNPGMQFNATLSGPWTTAVGAAGVVEVVTPGFFTTPVPADRVEVFVPRATHAVNGKLFGRLLVTGS